MSKPRLTKDCMYRKPATIGPESSIFEAIQLLVEYRITGVTVVDNKEEVAGVLSELDCLRAVLGNIYNEGNASQSLVGDFMTRDFVACKPNDDIVDAAQSMLAHNHRRRPVIQDQRLVGQLSCQNLLWALMEHTSFNERRR